MLSHDKGSYVLNWARAEESWHMPKLVCMHAVCTVCMIVLGEIIINFISDQ